MCHLTMPHKRLKLTLLLTLSLIAFAYSEASVDADDSDIDVAVDDAADVTVEVEEDNDIPYSSPKPSGPVYFSEHFDDPSTLATKWVKSEAKKKDAPEEIAVYDGKWKIGPPQRDGLKGDMGLILESKARHAAIAAPLTKPFIFNKNPLIVQYEALFPEAFECGGAYLKLLSNVPEAKDLKKFHNDSPYTIMFGPDKCGSDHKLHFIFKHRNPLNGSMEEKHCKKPKERLEEQYKDKLPHLYSLFVYPDNTFTIKIDGKIVNEGSLLEDFSPPVNPPREIDDPNDHKPEDWDEVEKIPDPDARKPDDWDENAPEFIPDASAVKPAGWLDDEPETIPDSDATRPDDWDDEIDGEWEPPSKANPACVDAPGCGEWTRPLVKNPDYKGKWHPSLVANPNYMGRWKPRRIPNPDFFEDKEPFRMTAIAAVGFELWSMAAEIHFDNIIITDDGAVAEQWAAETFYLKRRKLEKSSESVVARIINYTNERPWLYAVYVVAIGLPVVLIFVFCCGGSQDSERLRKSAEAKKTDLLQPDDEEPEQEEQEEQEEEEEEEELPGGTGSEEVIVTRASKSQLEVQEEPENNEEPVEADGGGDVPRSPKKRRPRKD